MEKLEPVGERTEDRRGRLRDGPRHHGKAIAGIDIARDLAVVDEVQGAFVHQLQEAGGADPHRARRSVRAEHLDEENTAGLQFLGARGEECLPVARRLRQDLRQFAGGASER